MNSDLETVHTFCRADGVGGAVVLNIFKRVELHQIQLVGQVSALPGVDLETLGGLICESFNSELKSRPVAQKESNG